MIIWFFVLLITVPLIFSALVVLLFSTAAAWRAWHDA